jgi:hypothetical protein
MGKLSDSGRGWGERNARPSSDSRDFTLHNPEVSIIASQGDAPELPFDFTVIDLEPPVVEAPSPRGFLIECILLPP